MSCLRLAQGLQVVEQSCTWAGTFAAKGSQMEPWCMWWSAFTTVPELSFAWFPAPLSWPVLDLA